MTTTLKALVIATFPFSCLALILSIVALGTDRWFEADVDLSSLVGGATDNRVNYGLFSGSYIRRVSSRRSYSLLITCDFGENKCAMLCGDLNTRNKYLGFLIQGTNPGTDGYKDCSPITLFASDNFLVQNSTRADDSELEGFMNCGIWLSTVLFLAFSCLFGIISSILAILNTVSNPVEEFLSITGLFMYNCIAFVSSLLAILLWGINFNIVLSENASIYDTIENVSISTGKANLGYSFWLVLGALILYACSMGVLIARYIIIRRQPKSIVDIEDRNENTIILY